MSLEIFIITVFCWVDNELAQVLKEVEKLRQRGPASQLEDAEVITMEIVGEFLGVDTDKGIWEYFGSHWRHFFPKITARCNFSRQAANLCQVKGLIQSRLAERLKRFDDVHLVDGVPMQVCHFKRSGRSRLFPGQATVGYCAAKSEYYYGFKGLVVTTTSGCITSYTVGTATVDEREAFADCADSVIGQHVIGDKGFIGQDYKETLKQKYGIELHTPLRANMNDPRPRSFVVLLLRTRRLVETVIGQLTERFHINRVRARNLYRMTSRFVRKILAHTLAVTILREAGYDDIQLECLVQ